MTQEIPIPRLPISPETAKFYRHAMRSLLDAGIEFLVGGSHALVQHTRMPRRSKDLDLFVLPADMPHVLEMMQREGYRTEVPYSHWLAKIVCGEDYIDIIYNSGNGLCRIDQTWFEHAIDGTVLDLPVKLCPLEETIWQKSFIMERHRFDGADVVHLLHVGGAKLDWPRLLERFGDHWRVLFSHLLLFDYVYPAEEASVPAWVREELVRRYTTAPPDSAELPYCRGTFLSSVQYQDDLKQAGLADARLQPHGPLTPSQLSEWMTAFEE